MLILTALSLSGCESYTPKPIGYFRIELPEKKYVTFESEDYPYSFEYADVAKIQEKKSKDDPFWIDVVYPDFRGRIYCSYKKVNGNFQGVVLKGIDKDYDWTFFENYLIAGEIFQINDSSSTNQTLISKKIADLLLLEVGDKFFTYFIIDGKVRVRPFMVSGIYTTGFSDYDKIFIIGDIKHIRKLNKWEEDECSGIEIEVNDFSLIEDVQESLFNIIGNRTDEAGNYYMMKSIQQINPQIFGWLDLLNTNVVIILILMIAVASFTMISGLLILILDRTNMIGILKALGATNHSVKKIFLYHTLLLVGKGMAWGNIIALTLTIVQKRFAILKLDPEMYYVDSVPIELSFLNILLVNIGTIIISYLVLRLSTHIITRIAPIKAIRFE